MRRQQKLSISKPLNRASIASVIKPEPVKPALLGIAEYSDLESDTEESNVPAKTVAKNGSDTVNHTGGLPDKAESASDVRAEKTSLDEEYEAFMADLNASSIPNSEEPQPIETIPITTTKPTPVPANISTAPFRLPPFSPSQSAQPTAPSQSQLLEKLDKLIARADQLPALPATLPIYHTSLIRERRTELNVRVHDWKAGGLQDSYFNQVLDWFESLLDSIEDSCYCPNGWVIHWDQVTESYYFECLENNAVEWSWPEEIVSTPETEKPKSRIVPAASLPSTKQPKESPILPTESSKKNPQSSEVNETVPQRPQIKKPDSVSISGKSKKLAQLLPKWHVAKSELAQQESGSEDEVDWKILEVREAERLQDWAEGQKDGGAGGANPNFMPVAGDRRVKRRFE